LGKVLTLEDVSLSYGRIPAVDRVELDIEAGEILGILGPNGSGKSSLLKLMCGLLSPDSGRVLAGDRLLRRLARAEIAREIGMVSQEAHFQFSFSVLEVVLMGRFPHLGKLQFEGRRDMQAARQALAATHCLHLAERSIHELSGGERQRVLIARALAQEPKLILFDEPTAFLDLKYKRDIFQLIASLSRERGMAVVVVSHDLDLAGQYCDRIALLKNGSIHQTGTPESVITARNVASVFDCPVTVDKHPATQKPRVNIL
jgi:iron complex transport system ATP-binding protein